MTVLFKCIFILWKFYIFIQCMLIISIYLFTPPVLPSPSLLHVLLVINNPVCGHWLGHEQSAQTQKIDWLSLSQQPSTTNSSSSGTWPCLMNPRHNDIPTRCGRYSKGQKGGSSVRVKCDLSLNTDVQESRWRYTEGRHGCEESGCPMWL